jgi:hypothetical protein
MRPLYRPVFWLSVVVSAGVLAAQSVRGVLAGTVIADRIRWIRDHGAGVRLGRLQGNQSEGQGRASICETAGIR